MSDASAVWPQIANAADVPSPALLVYPDRIEANVRKMIAMAGSPQRLQPHMKTHKLPEVIRLQRQLGIEKFKCATIAEAEMTAGCGAQHVLLAYQPVGPNVRRLLDLIEKFPGTRFATIVDNAVTVHHLSQAAQARAVAVEVFLDIDCGMGRTGIAPDADAADLYRLIARSPGVQPGGFHTFDGHIHDRDPARRGAAVRAAMAPIMSLRAELAGLRLPVPRIVAGGTPTFPFHARTEDIDPSPGTCTLWDAGYATDLPDLDFLPAALVFTRVVSKPGTNRLCLDLGYKAIAAESPPPRVKFFDLPDAIAVTHNEEHLVLETRRAAEFAIGDALYGVPWHICPTVALHAFAVVVRGGRAVEQWKIAARDRVLTI